MKFQIYIDRVGHYRWRLIARNKKIVADSSEGYVTKRGCERAIASIMNGADNAQIVDE